MLFTRAKKNMVVFTSLNPKDIKISGNSSKGIKALRDFLIYASKGVIDVSEETHRAPDNNFEIGVKEKLESAGYEVHPQVGVNGYRIDLGVKQNSGPIHTVTSRALKVMVLLTTPANLHVKGMAYGNRG